MRRKMSKVLIFLLLLILLIGIFAFRNLNMDFGNKRLVKKLYEKSGFKEDKYVMPDGSEISYLEGPNNGETLLLIHGQMVSKEDYGKVLEDLSKKFHVIAVDCYGHGKSSKNPSKYNINEISKDIISLINNKVEGKVVVTGHSSGALISANIASMAKDKVSGLILEDGPFFTTQKGRCEKTIAYLDFKLINDYLKSNNKEPYTKYFIENSYMKNIFNKDGRDNWSFLMGGYLKKIEMEKRKVPIIWYYPPELPLNKLIYMTGNLQDGTGDYDLRFAKTFYDFSFFKDFDLEKTLTSITCPTYVLHVAPSDVTKPSYYDNNGILLSAMDEKDAQKVTSLIKGSVLKGGYKSSHDIHDDLPKEFIQTIFEFKEFKDKTNIN